MPAYGRIHVPDARDAAFPMTLHLATVTPWVKPWRYWVAGPLKLNQGEVGACVGFAGANWEQASPTRTPVTNQVGFDLYYACKEVDGLPGVEGTYDRALMKVLQGQGRIQRYLWAQSPSEMISWVLTTGPVMVGTPWRRGMNATNRWGWVEVTDEVVGGHEFLIRGYSKRLNAYRCVNSWGEGWGLRGEFWIDRGALERLVFGGEGDCCAAQERLPGG